MTESHKAEVQPPATGPQPNPKPAAQASLKTDGRILEFLVCPVTRGPLQYDAARQELISRTARLAYPIRDGIPIMVREEARHLDDVMPRPLTASDISVQALGPQGSQKPGGSDQS